MNKAAPKPSPKESLDLSIWVTWSLQEKREFACQPSPQSWNHGCGGWRDPDQVGQRWWERAWACSIWQGTDPKQPHFLWLSTWPGTNDCTFLFQAKRRLELGESGHQYLSDGLKTPKGKGRAALRSPDSPKSKDSFISDALGCGFPTFKAWGWTGAKVWIILACFVLFHFLLCLSKK